MTVPAAGRNIKCVVEYDGTEFVGWQRQARGRSVQGEIESTLLRILQETVDVVGAGRTDAGVHARGQVMNFRTTTHLDIRKIVAGLNALLPEDIVVLGAEDAAPDFHARYDAKERRYSYLIRREPTALDRHVGWHLRYPLDLERMRQAATVVLNSVDYEAFCKSEAEVKHYRCRISRSEWTETGSELRYTVQADRFLHGMVRALVGTMVDIGRGATSLEQLGQIFASRNRSAAGMAAPPQGLILEHVVY